MQTLIARFIDAYGYSPNAIFCSVTGKEIGRLYADESEEIEAQVEDIADLRLRLLASMRPSMKWNKLSESSLDTMRQSHPVETMAYLLNRLFTPPRGATRTLPFDQQHESRILLFRAIANFRTLMTAGPQSPWDSVMHMLLELEAKLSLASEVAPFGPYALLDVPIESFMTNLAALLTPFHKRRVEWHRQREADAQFFAMNPGARRAFAKSWMEQQPAKPPTEATIRKAERQQEANFFAAIFDELNGDGDHKPMNQRPEPEIMVKPASAPVPSSKMPARFGGLKKA